MNRSRLAMLSVLLLAASPSAAEDASLIAGAFNPARKAPDFALPGSDGAELSLGRYRGKVVVLAFGFTFCPTVCPTTLAALAEARKKLGARGDSLQVVYITVDPERDDAERMRSYLARFDPTFIGGTGTPEQLAAVRRDYGIAASRAGDGGGSPFSHSSFTYLIDRDGQLRALMPYGHPGDDYAHDVAILLEK